MLTDIAYNCAQCYLVHIVPCGGVRYSLFENSSPRLDTPRSYSYIHADTSTPYIFSYHDQYVNKECLGLSEK